MQTLRKSIGVPIDSLLLLSAGELNRNKNHETVIRALAKLDDRYIHYVIAGRGGLHYHLVGLSDSLGVNDQVHLLGFRRDMPDLYKAADVCVFPSIREGLGMAALEGMASGLPLICADNRGTRDYAVNGVNAFMCRFDSIDDFANAIRATAADDQMQKRMGDINRNIVQYFDKENVNRMMKEFYSEYVG